MKWSPWLNGTSAECDAKLSSFAVFCWRCGWKGKGNQYDTIRLKMSSIRWYHHAFRGVTLNTTPHFDILLRGVRRLSSPVRKKIPVTPSFLRLLFRHLDISQPRRRLLWGAVLLAYFFLLRRSEYLREGSIRHAFCLKKAVFFSDTSGTPVPFKAATSVTVGLAGSKNDQHGRGAWRTMHASGDALLCPLEALRHILLARQELGSQQDEHLCVDLDCAEVNQALKMVATSVGVSPDGYTTHSLRAGGATALLNGNADSLAIKLLGRWTSNSFEGYPVLAADATTGLSSRMI